MECIFPSLNLHKTFIIIVSKSCACICMKLHFRWSQYIFFSSSKCFFFFLSISLSTLKLTYCSSHKLHNLYKLHNLHNLQNFHNLHKFNDLFAPSQTFDDHSHVQVFCCFLPSCACSIHNVLTYGIAIIPIVTTLNIWTKNQICNKCFKQIWSSYFSLIYIFKI